MEADDERNVPSPIRVFLSEYIETVGSLKEGYDQVNLRLSALEAKHEGHQLGARETLGANDPSQGQDSPAAGTSGIKAVEPKDGINEQAAVAVDVPDQRKATRSTASSIQKRKLEHLVELKTPWKEQQEIEIESAGNLVLAQQELPVHVPSHFACLLVYAALLVAYSIFIFWTWSIEPLVETYEAAEASDFGEIDLKIEVFCGGCVVHNTLQRKWLIQSSYEGFNHCTSSKVSLADQAASTVALCRTTDDISDASGLTLRLENHSMAARNSFGRPSVVVSGPGGLRVTTPLEAWHEKTLLLGLTVHRDDPECRSQACATDRKVYLASMQYDGEVEWGGKTWAGSRLNIRMLRMAHVYTVVPKESIPNLIASIGGASGILLVVLGILRKSFELCFFQGRRKRALKQLHKIPQALVEE